MKRESEENNKSSTSESPTSHRKRTHRDIKVPDDLTVEILKKLPVKYIVRSRCVSKQWSSIIGSYKDLIDSIVARSLTQPQPTHFIFHHNSPEKPFFIFSSTYPQQQKHAPKVSSLPCGGGFELGYHYIRGLICTQRHNLVGIYNPTTRQSFVLPEIKPPTEQFSINYTLFGYDPVMNQYKVLYFVNDLLKDFKQTCYIYTLGDPKGGKWSNIQGIENRWIAFKEVCINGVIYYGASILKDDSVPEKVEIKRSKTALLSFDVRLERFDRIKTPVSLSRKLLNCSSRGPTLVNYQGKLGCICHSNGAEIWVMEKQEWSKMVFCLPNIPFKGLKFVDRFMGVTSDGEIYVVDDVKCSYQPIHVYYYNPQQNSFRRVEIQGTGPETLSNSSRMGIIVVHDHVENTMWLC